MPASQEWVCYHVSGIPVEGELISSLWLSHLHDIFYKTERCLSPDVVPQALNFQPPDPHDKQFLLIIRYPV